MKRIFRDLIDSVDSVMESWGLPLRTAPRTAETAAVKLYLTELDGRRTHVGTLVHDAGEYVFTYAPAFIKRDDARPIGEFPVKERVYRSPKLWAFFEARLPSTTRPEVRSVMEQRKIRPDDTFRLLGELGGTAIASPYELAFEGRVVAT